MRKDDADLGFIESFIHLDLPVDLPEPQALF